MPYDGTMKSLKRFFFLHELAQTVVFAGCRTQSRPSVTMLTLRPRRRRRRLRRLTACYRRDEVLVASRFIRAAYSSKAAFSAPAFW